MYKLESPDRRVDEYAVNIIIENLIDYVDDQGWDTGILEEMAAFRHHPDVAIPIGEKSYTNVKRIQRQLITTNDRYVQVKWRYQSTYYVPLNLIEESNTIGVAEHSMSRGYSNEPDFIWWVCKVFSERDRLVKKVKSRCQNNIFKFGVEVTLIVEDVLRIDLVKWQHTLAWLHW